MHGFQKALSPAPRPEQLTVTAVLDGMGLAAEYDEKRLSPVAWPEWSE